MKCPKCDNKMFKKNGVWECSKCGFNFITMDNDIFTNLKNSDIPNKIRDYSENNETIGKIVDDIGEKISIQVKKEEAYIKNRKDDDSTIVYDENEFIFSKLVLDRVDCMLAAQKTK